MTIDDLYSDLIRYSVCACAKLFAEKKHMMDSTQKRPKGGLSKLCEKI